MIQNNSEFRNFIFPNNTFSFENKISKLFSLIYNFFLNLNYIFVEYNEISDIEDCFDNLLIKKNHPSRSFKDTFYINKKKILTTQATVFWNSAITFFPKYKKFFTIGKVYRKDFSSRHFPVFHQCDILHLNLPRTKIKSFIKLFLNSIFEQKLEFRFRSSFFQYTFCSGEVDIKCFNCNNKTLIFTNKICSLCQNNKWIEVLGYGIPKNKILFNISKNISFNNFRNQGLAFGVGLERLIMCKYYINDIRKLYLNN